MLSRTRVTWCMKANTYTSQRWTISRCARIVQSCASSADLMAMRSVSGMFWRIRQLPSSNVNMWQSIIASDVPTPSPSLRTAGVYYCVLVWQISLSWMAYITVLWLLTMLVGAVCVFPDTATATCRFSALSPRRNGKRNTMHWRKCALGLTWSQWLSI